MLFGGPPDVADHCSWQIPIRDTNELSGTWADVTFNFGPHGCANPVTTGSVVTDLSALGTHDSSGGDSDVRASMVEAP